MTINPSFIFSLITTIVTLGSVFIAIGVFKGRIQHNTETNKAQNEQMKTLATKDELAAAIKRSDEMLEIMIKRTEEDRAKGQGQWREFHDLISKHAERISVLENQQTTLMKSLDEIKLDIKSGFRDLQNRIEKIKETT